MTEMMIKNYTEKRAANMSACDGKNAKRLARWLQPQDRKTCEKEYAEISAKLAKISKLKSWGTKADNPELIAQLAALLKQVQWSSDDRENAFVVYQLSRYFLRIWGRGLAEERKKIEGTAPKKQTAKTEAPAEKPAPKKTQTKKAPAKKKAPLVKAEVVDTPVEPEVIDIHAPDRQTASLLNSLVRWLQDELSAEQKHDLVCAMVSALAVNEQMD